MIPTLLAGFLIGAVARRLAGGVLPIPGGTLVARATGALVLAIGLAMLEPHGAPLVIILLIAPLFYLGLAAGFPPNGGMLPRSWGAVGGVSQQHGWALAGPLALWAAANGLVWWPLVLAAVAIGPVYWAAQIWQPSLRWMGFNKGGLPDPPAWAEPWVGGAIGMALVVALGGAR